MLEAFDNLLINYPFHPVLWTLYAVNRRFAVRKPEMEKSTDILHYYRVTRPWLGGVTDSIRDIIARDDTTKNGCWFAYATIRNGEKTEMYWIPREWVKRIFVNERNNFELLPYEFCCRQVLKRTDCKLVRCQSHSISSKFFVDQYYFHVGCGPCRQEISTVIADFPMFVGIKQLALALQDESVTKNAEMLLCLLVGERGIEMKLEKIQKDNTAKEVCVFNSPYICNMLKHILMCKKCNNNLRKFLSVLEQCLCNKLNPFNDVDDEILCEFYYNDKIPCNKYVIDGEFDEMRNSAYDAIQSEDCLEQDPHQLVNNFIKDYCVLD